MKKVAILIETSRAYGRGLLRGISRFNQERRAWSTYFQPQGLGDPTPPWLATWAGDGILARIENRQLARDVIAAGIPTINLRHSLRDLHIPFIGADNPKVAEIGAEHLLSRGYQHFGFCGFAREDLKGFRTRGECFRKIVLDAGFTCGLYARAQAIQHTKSWEQDQRQLAKWLLSLPKPAGILAANDDLGFLVLDACQRAALRVPEDIGVIGVDNDEFLCELSVPKLSSIRINSEATGYRAAQLLDEWISTGVLPNTEAGTPPNGLVVRQSSDILATNDEVVLGAATFIRENACKTITVEDVVRNVGISRTSLEYRFKKVVRHSIHEEIHKIRIQRAKDLLTKTDLPIKWIAEETGFKSPQYLTRIIRGATGKTPAGFRRER
jgi:LacI family transcriptional regulator